MSDNVIHFTPRGAPPKDLPHLFTVHIYGDGVTTDTVIQQPDRPDGSVDMDAFLDTLTRVLMFTHMEQFERTRDPDDDLVLLSRVFRSSLVATRWPSDDPFETPGQKRWLRRRLADIYWQIDPRRGTAYRIHAFFNRLGRLIARMKGNENASRQDSSQ